MADESEKTVPEKSREDVERDFALVREARRRRYARMHRRRLRRLDVAELLESDVDRDRLSADIVARIIVARQERSSTASADPGALYIVRAAIARKDGRANDAVADLRRAIRLGVAAPAEAYHELGMSLLDLDDPGEYEAAVEAFSRVVELAPAEVKGYIGRAFSYESLGRIDDAVSELTAAIPLVRDPAPLVEQRGLFRLRQDRFADAIADFDAAIAGGRASVDVLVGRGTALREMGSMQEAEAAFTAAASAFPSAIMPRMQRALSRMMSGDLGGALPDLDWLIEQRMDDPEAYHAWGLRAVVRSQLDDEEGAYADVAEWKRRAGDRLTPDERETLERLENEAREGGTTW